MTSHKVYDVICNKIHRITIAFIYSNPLRDHGRNQIAHIDRLRLEIHLSKTIVHPETILIIGKIQAIIQFLKSSIPIYFDILGKQRATHYIRYRLIHIRHKKITTDRCVFLFYFL